MRISVKTLASVLMGVAIFAGFQGGRYFMRNRFQELGIAAAAALFVYAAVTAAFKIDNRTWNHWTFTPVLLIGFIMLCYAFVFSVNANTPVMPSLMASREFFLILIAPAIYLLYRSGYELERIERVFVTTLVILLINYLFHYMRMDLKAAFFSDDPTIHHLVTYDEWRGFRLKPPTYAIMILMLWGVMRFFQPGAAGMKLLYFGVTALCAYIWSLVLARAVAAALLLSIMLYPFFLSRRNRMNLVVLVAPVAIFGFFFVVNMLISHFQNADGGEIRLASYTLALENIPRHLFFGMGQSSGYSKTYQDIFGPKFFPSDLGLIGVTFKYGIVGVSLYLYFSISLLLRAVKLNWRHRKRFGDHHPLGWALVVFFTAMTLILILQPGLAYAQGLTAGAFTMAYTACGCHALEKQAAHGVKEAN